MPPAMPNAIVTGGNSGIGRATAVSLAASGYDVGFTWHAEDERAASAVEEIEAHGRRAVMRQVDLHDGEAGAGVVEELADALGSVDCFVSNAGYGTSTSVLEITPEDWRGVVEVDLTAAFLCFQVAARRMVAQGGGGSVVFVTSVHEHIPLRGNAPYSAAKHGLGGLVKVAALELAEHGIRVNAVAPGAVMTERQMRLWYTPETKADMVARQAIPLEILEEDIADAVVFLCADDSRMITKQLMTVDGGAR
jgi:NAD(P)-dependent dehydrogenase (short-subunit alcohol dehydrogenase family)